jgi:plastocyanin
LKSSAGALIVIALPSDLLAGTAQKRHHNIEILDFAFFPAEISVNVGDTITWTNTDIAPHTATAFGNGWDTQELKRGEAASLVVTRGMKQRYFCRYHPVMTGKIIIG